MKKSTMWSLAMALATSLSGVSSLNNDEDEDSKPEETVQFNRTDAKFAEELGGSLPRAAIQAPRDGSGFQSSSSPSD